MIIAEKQIFNKTEFERAYQYQGVVGIATATDNYEIDLECLSAFLDKEGIDPDESFVMKETDEDGNPQNVIVEEWYDCICDDANIMVEFMNSDFFETATIL